MKYTRLRLTYQRSPVQRWTVEVEQIEGEELASLQTGLLQFTYQTGLVEDEEGLQILKDAVGQRLKSQIGRLQKELQTLEDVHV